MTLTLAQTATFVSLWKHWRLTDPDLRELERQVMDNPLAGPVIRNTGGVRKTRFAPPSRGGGKSGGFRVCYLHVPTHSFVCFVLVYPKNEQANLTPEQQQACRTLVKEIRRKLDEQRPSKE